VHVKDKGGRQRNEGEGLGAKGKRKLKAEGPGLVARIITFPI